MIDNDDCGTVQFEAVYNDGTHELHDISVTLIGNDIVGVSHSLIEDMNPKFVTWITDEIFRIKQLEFTFVEHSEYKHYSFYRVSDWTGND